MASVLRLMELTISAADYTTVSRRAVTLPVIQPAQMPHGPLHVLIDSIGLQVYGAGQWLETKLDRGESGTQWLVTTSSGHSVYLPRLGAVQTWPGKPRYVTAAIVRRMYASVMADLQEMLAAL